MTEPDNLYLDNLDEDAALRMILEGTATKTGEPFFRSLVENLSKALKSDGAWVTEYLEESRRLRALAFQMDGQWVDNYEFDITGTPCEAAIQKEDLVCFPDRLIDLYPNDPDLKDAGFVSYVGMPLMDLDGKVLGHMAVINRRPMTAESQAVTLFRIFAARAAAEFQRIRAESDLRQREEKLGLLVDSAMDAIIELDNDLKVTRLNPAAEKVLGCRINEIVGNHFNRFLTKDGYEKTLKLIDQLDARPQGEQFLWIPGGLQVLRASGEGFSAEATLSRFEMQRKTFHTLILRNVNERLEAEEKIHSLTSQAEYLREELDALQNFDEIIGQNRSLVQVLREVEQVARTDASVLILGETGTGKELIARSIHAASHRTQKPLIKVNCAAIPATLIESEFFGHEKGAFTGASDKREGRFALADGGSIFLDEVGELPLDMQVKLLRVLQEGEFEPVGSSKTQKVDVRVIAATNRDLQQMAREGTFREDLYYRLNVFPLQVPPLRERGEDIVLLAKTFVKKFAQSMGRADVALSDDCARRLQAYSWPGNVRELQNVIERAMITSQNGRLDLNRALPEVDQIESHQTTISSENTVPQIRTAQEFQLLEVENIRRALDATNWKVSGEEGAAKLLGMVPSTLSSRIKTLGIKKPQ